MTLRFTQKDLIFNPSDNFRYVYNMPTIFRDPEGLRPPGPWGGILGVLGDKIEKGQCGYTGPRGGKCYGDCSFTGDFNKKCTDYLDKDAVIKCRCE